MVFALKHLSSIGVIIDNGYLLLSIIILISATGIGSLLLDIKIRLAEIRDAIKKDVKEKDDN